MRITWTISPDLMDETGLSADRVIDLFFMLSEKHRPAQVLTDGLPQYSVDKFKARGLPVEVLALKQDHELFLSSDLK